MATSAAARVNGAKAAVVKAPFVSTRQAFRQVPVFQKHRAILNKAPARPLPRPLSAAYNDEPQPPMIDPVAVVEPTPSVSTDMSAEDLKAALLDSLFGTERGLTASSEIRAEINELLAQLEVKNPTPSPTEALDMLDGSWKLVYTSNSELMALLAANNLPLVTIGDITQTIDGATETVTNKVQVTVPFSSTTVAAQAAIEVRSPKRLQVKFKQGTIKTPTITDSLEIPSTFSFMGQTLDLTAIQSAVKPLEQNLSGITDQIQNLIKQSPDLSFNIDGEQSQTWLLTTYLDADTRISRGDGGSVFVLVKDASLAPTM
eukprot:CAMPEP_0177777844 /NCGR_PEP_ID=MMETSP0491_2-20121128/15608_1 /TAXON_ID=63592 /ORGANISM="Tetraselmis chuii, Strain PLY429" /LENGTH=315 /DNA_ID=CAMNT_0019297019 /DNA_START=99 /DNA_END=1046 /DNA_ORIENTATION=+